MSTGALVAPPKAKGSSTPPAPASIQEKDAGNLPDVSGDKKRNTKALTLQEDVSEADAYYRKLSIFFMNTLHTPDPPPTLKARIRQAIKVRDARGLEGVDGFIECFLEGEFSVILNLKIKKGVRVREEMRAALM